MTAFDRLATLAPAGSALARRGRGLTARMLLRAGEAETMVTFSDGAVVDVAHGPFVMPSWDFGISAPVATWSAFLAPTPPPKMHDLIGLVRHGGLRFEGNLHPLMAHLLYLKLLFAAAREARP
jgi:hypothetical protein